jgi:hypothetical protein
MRLFLTIAGVILLLLACVPVAVGISQGLFAGMTIHGWIALGLGCGVSLLVGGGLMALVFHSSRHGYDDQAGDGL